MQCARCRNEAVMYQSYSGRHLCGKHLVLDIEARAKKTIRMHRWLSPGDHFAVPLGGDPKSAALLVFLQDLIGGRRDVRLSAILPGEENSADPRNPVARGVAESLHIPCTMMQEPGITRIAVPASLDDSAHQVLAEFLFGDTNRLVHPPQPNPGIPGAVCPFIAIPSGEIELYWQVKGTGIPLMAADKEPAALPRDLQDLFDNYCRSHPATRYAMLHLAEDLAAGNGPGIACGWPGTGVWDNGS